MTDPCDIPRQLEQLVRVGKAAAYRIRHANILLAVDESQVGPKLKDAQAAEAFGVADGKETHRCTLGDVDRGRTDRGHRWIEHVERYDHSSGRPGRPDNSESSRVCANLWIRLRGKGHDCPRWGPKL